VKLEQTKRETNHKIKMLQQQHRRSCSQRSLSADVVDLSAVPHEEDEKTDNDIREELALMETNEESKRNV
jgi:hypothetical protein